ncbi:MAG: hypothetical protein GX463_11855 [Methanothrix sp.]|nr:hypothetical protein [Methanothrix sp.]
MDHEVHINNGGKDAPPIIFRLLPGEETIFNLKVINHGPPGNISLQASNPLFKAVRLKKPDHLVTEEEVIPVLARMPVDRGRLDGEIILFAGGRESRVPITLLCDSEDPVDDLNDALLTPDEDGVEDIMGEDEYGEREEYEDFHEYEDDSGRREPHLEEDDGDIERDKSKKLRRISFSMDADLERYRSSKGRKRLGHGPGGNEDGAGEEGEDERHFIPRYSTRIDDSFVDKGSRKGQPQSGVPGPTTTSGQDDSEQGMRDDKEAAAGEGRAEDQVWQGEPVSHEERVSHEEDVRPGYSQLRDIESREILYQAERDELNLLEGVETDEYGLRSGYEGSRDDETVDRSSRYALLGRMDDFSLTGLIQAVPIIILLILIATLVLTFVTEIVPEFPGALASSILMVTLIIYGAARLLKA